QLLLYQHLAMSISGRTEREYRGCAQLLFGRFRPLLMGRLGAGVVAIAVLLIAAQVAAGGIVLAMAATAFVLTALGELIGRYLFYVRSEEHTSELQSLA